MMPRNRILWLLLAAAPIVAGPLIQSRYLLQLFINVIIFALLALSMDLVLGRLRLLSFGHAAFFGGGAYVAALLSKSYKAPFLLALLAAVVAMAGLGYLLGKISFRFRGVYFAVSGLALAEILRTVVTNLREVTGGAEGMSGIPTPAIGLLSLATEHRYLLLLYLVLVATLWGISRLDRSDVGWFAQALSQNEPLARSLGIHPPRIKLQVFMLSTAIAGLAGALYAFNYRVISPENMGTHYTILPMVMVLFGGKNSLAGPVLGSLLFTILPDLFKISAELQMIAFGGALLVATLFLPHGVVRLSIRLLQKKGGEPHGLS